MPAARIATAALLSLRRTPGWVATALCLLSACGGGDDEAARNASASAATARALSAPFADGPGPLAGPSISAEVTADMALDWAQYQYPELFPQAIAQRLPAVQYQGVTYNARAYSGAWGTRYLGITADGRIFGMGDFTGQALQQFETLAYWSSRVQADQCAVSPASCGVPAGPLNACARPAALALVAGSRFFGAYAVSGESSGNYSVERVVEGAAVFEGHSAIRVVTRALSSETGAGGLGTSSSESSAYLQDGGAGFIRTLGAVSNISTTSAAGTFNAAAQTTYAPAFLNIEYSIGPGESISQSVRSLTTANGQAIGPSTATTVHRFLARETISVAGRSYDTCRYTQSDADGTFTTTTWRVVGQGVVVRSQTVNNSMASLVRQEELVSGTLDGAPL